nr:zinc finger FYVE domain-containing protein 1-like isoform X1 [Procambarus clarkii]XP_045608690.1 zinc finger FYVE domain-containing protein 1-like isoform X1 [Procambarus clarkii]XP_045608691.1 zinc finger FYVE domain-containing protein 1-like isoform X1 [Procambarus clarkii]XP_045608692.1 zinc finger FYVE domain-containing protein 1-like isoform X1 [Procambarus clarkii]
MSGSLEYATVFVTMEPRRGPVSSNVPGVAHSIRIEGSGGLSRIPASLSVPVAPSASSAIMSSLASCTADGHYDHSFNSLSSLQSITPDLLNNELRSVDLGPLEKECFKLINEKEELQVKNASELLKKMGCAREKDLQVKVVSIFGNTGEGKSYTLNQIFFKGAEVFKTSSNQTSCTLGVWGAYNATNKALVLDTEGMLGISNSSKQRKRLLLKVLAVSDVIIYRTRSERLNTDMYKFLAEASRAYTKYFRADLEAVARKAECDCVFGPPVFIFHDTRHTSVLIEEAGQKPEEQLKENFTRQNLKIDGFNSLHYIGECNNGSETDFTRIRNAVIEELQNNGIRSPRRPKIVLDMLETINRKFSGQIQSSEPAFPDEYFTCTSVCAACQARCCLFMNHATHDDGSKDHEAERQCKYHHQFENKVFLCRKCDSEGERRIVVPKTSSAKDNTWLGLAKYAWAGYVLECEKCGIIYRSRQYWYGNESPDRCVVKEEYQHVWSGTIIGGAAHAGRQVLEGVAALGSALSTISAPPAKVVSSWLTNQVNPAYWTPNHLCTHCKMCRELLDTIHHCRKCGEGFCDSCSDVKMPVPEMGWGEEPVRVCKNCFKNGNGQIIGNEDNDCATDERTVRARQVSEVISGTLASVAKYPIEFLKDSARPSYWIPDEVITKCIVCEKEFGPRLTLHHCRACGQGVCNKCSPNLRPVKERGWDHPVRVCNNCLK